jgi:hypothetical protein
MELSLQNWKVCGGVVFGFDSLCPNVCLMLLGGTLRSPVAFRIKHTYDSEIQIIAPLLTCYVTLDIWLKPLMCKTDLKILLCKFVTCEWQTRYVKDPICFLLSSRCSEYGCHPCFYYYRFFFPSGHLFNMCLLTYFKYWVSTGHKETGDWRKLIKNCGGHTHGKGPSTGFGSDWLTEEPGECEGFREFWRAVDFAGSGSSLGLVNVWLWEEDWVQSMGERHMDR